MTSDGGTGASGAYSEAYAIISGFIDSCDYANLREKLSEPAVSSLETGLLGLCVLPQDSVRNALNVLRNGFRLDYDDLVIGGDWFGRLPQMIARNYLLGHFLEIGNGLRETQEVFSDATLNTAADDYTGFVDLLVIRIQTMGEETHYSFSEEDIVRTERYLDAILILVEYCRNMLDMSSTLRPSLFQMRNRRMESRVRSVIEMSVLGKDCPGLKKRLSDIAETVNEITSDRELHELQRARNERYKESKIRLYRYTLRVTEDLNNQLEACDPYDLTHRNDLRKQLEQVQIFMRSFDKDR